jgi:hypothetical protein
MSDGSDARDPNKLLSISEAAIETGLSRKQIKQAAKTGDFLIRPSRNPRGWGYVRRGVLQSWLRPNHDRDA